MNSSWTPHTNDHASKDTDLSQTRFKYSEQLTEADAPRLRFRRQWIIQGADDPPRPDWKRHDLGKRHVLWAHPDLRVRTVPADGGGILLLGLVIRPGAPSSDALPSPPAGRDLHEFLVEELKVMAGTYVVARYSDDEVFLYTDPAGMMGVYYADGRAASTPSLLPGIERDTDLDAEFPFQGVDEWYTGSLCPYRGVRILIANHRLSLTTGERKRFWPESPPQPISHEEGVKRICDLLRGSIEAVLRVAHPLLSITGGKDSRVNLAAARDHVDDIEFFTIRAPWIKKCDKKAAADLASRFGLEHIFVDDPGPDPWLLDLYDEISGGMAIGARRDIIGAAKLVAGLEYIHINGNLGALMKSFFWPDSHPQVVQVEAISREFMNRSPRIVAGVEEWIATVSDTLPAPMTYNLCYLEQTGGRRMSIGESASNLFFESFTPFNSRQVFELICATPTSAQFGGTLLVDLVREMWPELLVVPYCRITRRLGMYLPKAVKFRLKQLLGKK